MKKKKNDLMSMAKDTLALGVLGGVTGGIMGGMASMPGAPKEMGGVTSATMTGMNLLAVGQMGKIGMSLPGMMSGKQSKKKKGLMSKWM